MVGTLIPSGVQEGGQHVPGRGVWVTVLLGALGPWLRRARVGGDLSKVRVLGRKGQEGELGHAS